jgi:trans-2,3-dihydro-3-hydroxyanthranilate isomerase
MHLEYLHLDVFTSTPFEGNQLAVFTNPPAGMSAALMRRIAREMAFSESTFVFPREGSGDVRMRIFTPGEELPMAGHPTIGTTFALASEGVIAAGRDQFVFELGVGPTPVSLEWKDGRLDFAWMTQQLPTFAGVVADRDGVARALGIEPADLVPGQPVEAISCGVPFLYVPLATRRAVDAVAVDRRALVRVCEASGVRELPVFFFTTERTRGNETVYSRMIASGFGIAEDPATGAASGPLGCYLVTHGLLTPEAARSFVSLQGVAMGRPSRVHVSIDTQGGTITRVRVGGQSILVGRGTLTTTSDCD